MIADVGIPVYVLNIVATYAVARWAKYSREPLTASPWVWVALAAIPWVGLIALPWLFMALRYNARRTLYTEIGEKVDPQMTRVFMRSSSSDQASRIKKSEEVLLETRRRQDQARNVLGLPNVRSRGLRQKSDKAWEEFDELSGTRLWTRSNGFGRSGFGRWELVTKPNQVEATVRNNSRMRWRPKTVTVGERRFHLRAFMLAALKRDLPMVEAVDDRGVLSLRVVGRHFDGADSSATLLPGGRSFVFPVQGSQANTAVLSAINEFGICVFWVREARARNSRRAGRRSFEMVVAPYHPLSPETLLVMTMAPMMMQGHFSRAGSPGRG